MKGGAPVSDMGGGGGRKENMKNTKKKGGGGGVRNDTLQHFEREAFLDRDLLGTQAGIGWEFLAFVNTRL